MENKLTWTLLPDIDAPNPKRDVEEEQEQELIAKIGLSLWGELCQREMEERNEQT